MLTLRPIDFRTASDFVDKEHRHHRPPVGWKFGIGVNDGDKLVGVAMVGRPVARRQDDGRTLEVTRLCTDGTKNACSILYAAAWRAAKAMGYKRMLTYILETEDGTSLRAAGWEFSHVSKGGSWSQPSRPRVDKAPICRKLCYKKEAQDDVLER